MDVVHTLKITSGLLLYIKKMPWVRFRCSDQQSWAASCHPRDQSSVVSQQNHNSHLTGELDKLISLSLNRNSVKAESIVSSTSFKLGMSCVNASLFSLHALIPLIELRTGNSLHFKLICLRAMTISDGVRDSRQRI